MRLGHRIPSPEETLTQQEMDSLVRELLDSYKDSDITKDPFMSPALAPDDLLQGLPPVDVIVCHLHVYCTENSWDYPLLVIVLQSIFVLYYYITCMCTRW